MSDLYHQTFSVQFHPPPGEGVEPVAGPHHQRCSGPLRSADRSRLSKPYGEALLHLEREVPRKGALLHLVGPHRQRSSGPPALLSADRGPLNKQHGEALLHLEREMLRKGARLHLGGPRRQRPSCRLLSADQGRHF